MNSYPHLLDLTNSISGRPDLVNETRVAITKAVRKFHLADTWDRDLASATLDLSLYATTDYKWAIDLTGPFMPRFRRLHYARPKLKNTISGGDSQFLPALPDTAFFGGLRDIPILTPKNITDTYDLEFPAYAYVAGNQIILKYPLASALIAFGYHQLPDITVSTSGVVIESWIADAMPEAIACEAGAEVLNIAGKDGEAQIQRAYFAQNLEMLKMQVQG